MFEPSGKCLYSASNDYLQSLSWEPSKCYDSVFCQWKQVVDITIASNRLTAASMNQNMVSFYAVDLMVNIQLSNLEILNLNKKKLQ